MFYLHHTYHKFIFLLGMCRENQKTCAPPKGEARFWVHGPPASNLAPSRGAQHLSLGDRLFDSAGTIIPPMEE